MSATIYVIAISLQLAGALLLLVNATSTKRDNLIKSFAKSRIIYRDGDTKELSYNVDAFKGLYRNIYLNKFAFAYISLGYFIGIFGDISAASKIIVLFCVAVVAFIDLLGAYFVVDKICMQREKVTKKITNEELIDLGIEPDAESISTEEIDKMFADV